jgi:NADH-quinone oxidoreductase subunit L
MEQHLHLWLIPLLPLIGAAINGFFGKKMPKSAVSTIALLFPGLAFAQALWIITQLLSQGGVTFPYNEQYGTWITAGDFVVKFGYYLDQLSMVMLMVVTGVGFLIHIYSVGYMHDDPGYYRFFSYLNLFMFFMLTLILADNYLLLFVGWEGVGLASYLLIGFYFLKHSAAQAGKKAFIVNRIGDAAFLVGMFLIIKLFGSLDFGVVLPAAAAKFTPEVAGAGVMTAIALCLMVGATGKSAQIPLYVWLPDAMEGPTPVSALIHAATMVTAGIYMTARSSAIFNNAPMALTAVAVIGALTAIFAASIGITQTDIKRVLAYSTISQLGYMFMACGVAAYSAAIFHLMTHAFFKALLFLSAGSVIHAMGGEQDMRNMGGMRKYIPWTFGVMAIGTVAIAGIPPLAGFVSKDEILWKAYSSGPSGWIFWAIGLVTAFMTSFYMFRLLFMTFWGELRSGATARAHATDDLHQAHKANVKHAYATHSTGSSPHAHDDHHGHHGAPHESPWVMLAPLVVLAVLSIVGGWVGWPHALGGSNRFEKYLEPVFEYHGERHAVTDGAAHAPVGTQAHGEVAEGGKEVVTPAGTTTAAERATTESHGEEKTEITLTVISVLAGFGGLGLAWLFYVGRPELPARIAASAGGLYRTVLNKYYVDEGYYAAFVNPIVNGSTRFLWRTVDAGLIDGTVNGAGSTARAASDKLRRMQSGNIRSYAGWVAAGGALVLVYLIVKGMQH